MGSARPAAGYKTLLELLPQRDRNQKKLLKLLNRIRRRAGKVRDLDVQLAALRSLKIPQEPRRKTQLTHGLIDLRAKHEKKLRKLLTKDAIRDLRKRLRRAARGVPSEATRDALKVARAMVNEVARPRWTDRRRSPASVPHRIEARPLRSGIRSKVSRERPVHHSRQAPAGCRGQLARLVDPDPGRRQTTR